MRSYLSREQACHSVGRSARTLQLWAQQRLIRVYPARDDGKPLYDEAELKRAKKLSAQAYVERPYKSGWGRGHVKPDPDWPTLWDE